MNSCLTRLFQLMILLLVIGIKRVRSSAFTLRLLASKGRNNSDFWRVCITIMKPKPSLFIYYKSFLSLSLTCLKVLLDLKV